MNIMKLDCYFANAAPRGSVRSSPNQFSYDWRADAGAPHPVPVCCDCVGRARTATIPQVAPN